MSGYEELGRRVGALVDVKNAAYGSAFDDAGSFLKLLYPNGIEPDQYSDALALVRIFDKMKRIATDRDALGESPYQDIAGYGLLGLNRVEKSREKAPDAYESNLSKAESILKAIKVLESQGVTFPELRIIHGHSYDANGAPVESI